MTMLFCCGGRIRSFGRASKKGSQGVDGQEFDQFVKEMAEQGQYYRRRTGDYRCSFAMSDALISDATTFLQGEYNANRTACSLYAEERRRRRATRRLSADCMWRRIKGHYGFIRKHEGGSRSAAGGRIAAFIDDSAKDALNGCGRECGEIYYRGI